MKLKCSLFLFVLFSATIISCNGSAEKKSNRVRIENESEINPRVEEIDNIPDSALVVRLDKISDDSISVYLFNSKKTNVYSISKARMLDAVKGQLNCGDIYSVFPNEKEKALNYIINLSDIDGQWFYDMEQHRGFVFEQGGGLSSINSADICFRQWKLLNGELYIYYVDPQMVAPDRHEYLVDKAEIISLSKENLRFRFLNKMYDCKRQHGVIKI